MSNCNCHTTDNRDGSGQLGRYLKALDPGFAPIDDRSIQDLLVFAKRHAGQIRYYEVPDEQAMPPEKNERVNWREFFRRDMAVIAASVGTLQIDSIRSEYLELRDRLDEDPSIEKYAALFAIIIGLATRIDRWLTVAIPENPLRTDLDIALNAYLRDQFRRIMAYEEGFKLAGFKSGGATAELKLDYDAIYNDEAWGMKQKVDPDASIYTGSSPEDKLRNAALYVDDIFNSFFSFIQTLIDQSDKYIHFALESYPAHQPHMTLFIAFLQLFQLAKAQMNELTGRMLDFYYKEVLQLTPKGPLPDKAHVVFELAKDVTEHHIAAGTALNAGKDAAGKGLQYQVATDFVVNTATVKEIKTIYIDKQPPAATQPNKTIQRIFASPVANSADGQGAPFAEPNPKWPTFGRYPQSLKWGTSLCDALVWAKENLVGQPPTQIGFAIASPQLLLQGGNRIIALKLNALNEIFAERKLDRVNRDRTEKNIQIRLSGEKEWVTIDDTINDERAAMIASVHRNGGALGERMPKTPAYFVRKDIATLFICLPATSPAVVSYNNKLHKGVNFATPFPVLQILLGPGIKLSAPTYKRLKFSDLELSVRVGSNNRINEPNNDAEPFFDGLRLLHLQNDDALLDAKKPFDPFTAYPKPGNSFYIGSHELFNKPINELSVHLRHALEGGERIFQNEKLLSFRVSLLDNRYWETRDLIDSGTGISEIELTRNLIAKTVRRKPLAYPVSFENGITENGFLQLQLTGRNATPDTGVTEQPVAAVTFERLAALAPFLQMKEISLSYFSELRDMQPGVDQFFHVYPFGAVETYITPGRENTPVFTVDHATGGIEHTDAGASTPVVAYRKRAGMSVIGFGALDDQREGLLVDAHELLLPQFSFEGLYDKYQKGASRNFASPTERKDISPKVLDRIAGMHALAKMAVSASGLYEQVSGGNNQYSGNIQEEGMLFIGLGGAVPLQSISLLFQFAEGSAADEDNDPPVIHWSYLTNNEWRPLRGEDLVSDGTFGFQTTGIVKVNLPADATNNNTIITNGLHWLCASVTEHSERIPQLINIVTQAVEAVLNDQGNDPSHYANALPAGSISKLEVPAPAISKVQQPFASFDGKPAEISSVFYTRVSERLRHKNRAINAWDYEHLILNRYPTVYKVKAINHTDPNCLCRTATTRSTRLSQSPAPTAPSPSPTGEVIAIEFRNGQFEAKLDAKLEAIKKIIISDPSIAITLRGYFMLTSDASVLDTAIKQLLELMAKVNIDTSKINILPPGTKQLGTIDITLQAAPVTDAPAVPITDKPKRICCGPQVAPGHVLIVPIANLRNRNALNPLQPKTSRRLMLEIEQWLKTLVSPFVKIHVRNPVYEQVITSFRVKFISGSDKGFYLKQLNEELVRYLTPWAFDENADVQFGQKVYASNIINFIEERPYVDFITDFLMGVCKSDCCVDTDTEVNIAIDNNQNARLQLEKLCGCDGVEAWLEQDVKRNGEIAVQPSTPRSLLVSVPQHIIIPYEEKPALTPCEKRTLDGIRPVPPAPTRPTGGGTKPVGGGGTRPIGDGGVRPIGDVVIKPVRGGGATPPKPARNSNDQSIADDKGKKDTEDTPAADAIAAPKPVKTDESVTLPVKKAAKKATKTVRKKNT
jgi:hypothetical protein